MQLCRIIFLVLILISAAYESNAQRNAIGTSWSMSTIGITYEYQVKENTFLLAGIHMELGEAFLNRSQKPGYGASFTWNSIIAETESVNGNSIKFFAGPGAAVGYCKDLRLINKEHGLHGAYFGLKGRAGLEIQYDRKVNIIVCVAPVLGLHLAEDNGNYLARYYRYGILQTIMPEISINYRF